MKIITYYSVHDAFDAEGRGPDQEIGAFFEEIIATDYAKGKGNYGHDAHVTKKVIIICDSEAELVESQLEQTRQRALAKLTTAEKDSLGL